MDELKKQAFGIQAATIGERMAAFNKFKEQVQQNAISQNIEKKFEGLHNVYSSGQTASDQVLKAQSNLTVKQGEIAMWGRKYAISRGKDWSSWNDKQVIDTLGAINPEFKAKYKAYINDPNANDSTGFAIDMGWERPKEEVVEEESGENTSTEEGPSFLVNFFSPIMKGIAGVETLYEEKQNKINRIKQENYNEEGVDYNYDEKNSGSFAQYMYDKYGSYLSMYLNDDKRDIVEKEWEYISKNPDILDRYKNASQSWLSTGEGALDTAFTATAPAVKALLMGIGDTKVGGAVLGTISELLALGGEQVNKLPVLKEFRDNLPTEEDQARFDALVGNMIVYKVGKNKAKDIEGGINPISIFNKLKAENPNANILDIASSVKNNLTSMIVDGKATTEKINETAGKIVKGRNLKDQKEASNALSKIDTKKVKTYTELYDRMQKAMDKNMAQQSDIYKQDTTTYKPEQTRSTVDVENAGRTTTIELTPVEDAIELLKEMYEGDAIQMAGLENLINKFNEEGLTREEINNLSKAISSKSTSYNAKNELKKTKSAQDVERIRQAVKEFARQGDEELTSLDRDWGNMKNTQDLVKSMSDEVLKAKQNLANKNILQKVGGLAGEILDFVGGKNFIQKALPKLLGDDKMSAITREKQLQSNLKKLTRLTNRLKKATTAEEVKSAAEEFNNAMALPE